MCQSLFSGLTVTVIEIKVLMNSVMGGRGSDETVQVNKILNSTVPSTSKPSGNVITIRVTVISHSPSLLSWLSEIVLYVLVTAHSRMMGVGQPWTLLLAISSLTYKNFFQMTFTRPANHRQLTFEEIAKSAKITVNEVCSS